MSPPNRPVTVDTTPPTKAPASVPIVTPGCTPKPAPAASPWNAPDCVYFAALPKDSASISLLMAFARISSRALGPPAACAACLSSHAFCAAWRAMVAETPAFCWISCSGKGRWSWGCSLAIFFVQSVTVLNLYCAVGVVDDLTIHVFVSDVGGTTHIPNQSTLGCDVIVAYQHLLYTTWSHVLGHPCEME